MKEVSMVAGRIVSLLASGTEILCALGLSDRLAAISHECDFPPEILDRPRITSTHLHAHASSGEIDEAVRACAADRRPLYEINVDVLSRIAPDLIVTQAHCEVCAVNLDEVITITRTTPSLGRTRIVALQPATLEDNWGDILRVAQAAGCSDCSESLLRALTQRVQAVQSKTAFLPIDRRPRVVCLEWIDPIMVAANWMPDLLSLAGGRCDLTTSGQRSRYTDWNDVRRFDPEVMVIMPCGFDLARTEREAPALFSLPGWLELSAVRNRRVFVADGNAYFNRSGPRIVDSLEALASAIHPGLFRDFSSEGCPAADRLRGVLIPFRKPLFA